MRAPIPFLRRLFRSLRYFLGYHSGRTRLSYLPRTITIEATSSCNLNCRMCPHSFNHSWKDGHMEWELYRKLIAEIKPYAFRVIFQFRGEALLHKQLVPMVRLASEAGLETTFNTNATALTPRLSAELMDAGLQGILFSFNGETRETHDRVSQSVCFDRTLANALEFLKIKKERNLSTPRVRIQVLKFIGEPGEEGRLEPDERFKALFAGLPVDSLGSMWAINRSGDNKASVGIPIRTEHHQYLPCRWIWSDMVVGWNGRVLPCCNDFSEDYVLGDANRQTLREIWNGKPMQALRKALVDKRYADIPLCRDCDILWSVDHENSAVKQVAAKMVRKLSGRAS